MNAIVFLALLFGLVACDGTSTQVGTTAVSAKTDQECQIVREFDEFGNLVKEQLICTGKSAVDGGSSSGSSYDNEVD